MNIISLNEGKNKMIKGINNVIYGPNNSLTPNFHSS